MRNCSAKFRLSAFYRKKYLKDEIFFSCKELEVLEAKRKCRRSNITEFFQVPGSYFTLCKADENYKNE